MVEQSLLILAAIVGVLAVLQGWQMVAARRKNHNPGHAAMNLDGVNTQLTRMNEKLDKLVNQGGKMEQRLTDIWSKM